MKKYTITLWHSLFCLSLLWLLLSASGLSAAPEPRQRLLMDYHWKFLQADVMGAEKPNFADGPWRTLNLPHDWSIEGEFQQEAPTKGSGGYLPTGIGWYRKRFNLPAIQKGQKYGIEFGGVYMNSDVWINGHFLGRHPYGYTSFDYDLTPFLKKGENVVAVRVDNSVQPNSRWYSGSGIYRHVWLNVVGPVHIAQWGTYITTPTVQAASATIAVRTSIENSLTASKNMALRSVIQDAAGKTVAALDTPVSLPPSATTHVEQTIPVPTPALWSLETPTLYTLRSSLVEAGKVHDTLTSSFGIRTMEYDTDKGFFLNGRHVKMNGVCLHMDGGCLGDAVPEQAWVRRLQRLKDMGCNAIRTAHNPPDPEFLDLCDKMGFLVMDEAFDEWEVAKGQVAYGYHLHFDEWSQRDLLSMIHRDRNHPSVALWSAGNEVPDQSVDRGQETLKQLLATFHREDPTRPVTVANDQIAAENTPAKIPFLDMEDIVGYNYVDRWLTRRELYYSLDRRDHPHWKMIGTENSAARGSRGPYSLPSGQPGVPDYRTGMIQAEQLWKVTSVNDYVIGDFLWAGIDYLGEAAWPNKNSSSGVMDLCGFPKDSYYFYQSQWTIKPMVHAFPHWNWPGHEGEIIPVIAYTNCETVELFLNGKSFGKKSVVFPQQGHSGGWNRYARPYVSPTTSDLHLSWDVPYQPGTLKLVGIKGGETVTEEIRTTAAPTAIRLSTDRNDLKADAWDIADVKVEVIDEAGLVVPNADALVKFTVEGAGVLLATDNGDPQDKTSMKSKQRRAYGGLALAVIQATEKPGVIRVTASSANLKSMTLLITSHKPDPAALQVENGK